MLLAGRHALITGAGSGIGAATAARFLDEGARVVLWDVDRERLDRVVAELEARGGGEVHAGCIDVTDEPSVLAAMEDELVFETVDTVVANAGALVLERFEQTTADDLRRVLDVGVVGTFNVFRAALPRLRRRGGGVLLATSSVAGLRGSPHLSAYTASKFAVTGLVESLGRELAGAGIRVCAVAPGFVDTEMLPDFIRARSRITGTQEGDMREALETSIPLGRFADPREIADVFAVLASDLCAYVTGTTVEASGGIA